MDIHPIKTSDDHKQALLRIDALMNAKPGTEDGTELDVLVTLVEAFEHEHQCVVAPGCGRCGITVLRVRVACSPLLINIVAYA